MALLGGGHQVNARNKAARVADVFPVMFKAPCMIMLLCPRRERCTCRGFVGTLPPQALRVMCFSDSALGVVSFGDALGRDRMHWGAHRAPKYTRTLENVLCGLMVGATMPLR